MRAHLVKATLLLAPALLLAACSGDGTTAPAAQAVDLQAALSVMSASGVDGAVSQASSSTAPATAAPAIVPSACAFSATTQSFGCPTVTMNGVTITRSYVLYDAAGHVQSAYDKATTASVKVVSSITGTMSPTSTGTTTMSGSMTVNGHTETTLSGLLTGKLVENGLSTMSTQGSMTMNGITIPISMSMTQKTTDLALPAPGSATHYPLSGTVTVDLTSNGSGGMNTSVTEHMTMTFNGTSTVTVTLTSSFGTTVCKIDLAGKTPMSCTP